jgi:hypothetical protein
MTAVEVQSGATKLASCAGPARSSSPTCCLCLSCFALALLHTKILHVLKGPAMTAVEVHAVTAGVLRTACKVN